MKLCNFSSAFSTTELDVFNLRIEINSLQIRIAVANVLNKYWLYKDYTQKLRAVQEANYWLNILKNERVVKGEVTVLHSGFV